MRRVLQIISLLIIFIGIIIGFYFFWKLNQDYTISGKGAVALEETGLVGDFIGGVIGTIFSLAAFIILVLTLNEQTRLSTRERFENKFFDLLKLHRENVLELQNNNENGRKVLHNIFEQFLICRDEVKPFLWKKKLEDIYNPQYLEKLRTKLALTQPNINLLDCAKLNIPYIITFFGLGAQGKMSIMDIFSNKYKPEFYQELIDYMAMKPLESSAYYDKWLSVYKKPYPRRVYIYKAIRDRRNDRNLEYPESDINEKSKQYFYNSDFIKYYGGHQYQLGHYFRHLFLSFTFINERPFLTDNEKYYYAKILRAQLSTSEQALLFINSLSCLGLTWDLIPNVKKHRFDFIYKKRLAAKRLITKYNLITNLAGREIFGIVFNEFYPNVKFEFSDTDLNSTLDA